jgi:sulfite reductase (NADPH) hemoprotein beta-component
MPDVVSRLVEIYLEKREADERFVDTVERLGIGPFKAGVYGTTVRTKKELSEGVVTDA